MKKRTSKDLDRAKGIQEQRAMRQPDNQTLFRERRHRQEEQEGTAANAARLGALA